jgi:hypothetical protein
MLKIPKDSADISTYFVLRDSVTHAPKTGGVVTGIDLYSVNYRAAISAKADCAALGAANSAHADNSGFEIGLGLYRIDWPDIWTDAVKSVVQLVVVCTGCDTIFQEVEITGLPAVAAGLTGGLRIERAVVTAAVAADSPDTNTATVFKTTLASAVNDYYKDCLVLVTSGAMTGQVKKITAYNGSTKYITVDGGFTAVPVAAVTFLVINQ